MARIGELLLKEQLVTPKQLAEALATQVVQGGRIGTNLIEFGFIQEKDFMRVLGQQHNMAYASGEMVPDPAALGIVSHAFLDDNDVVPMRVDATRVTVAVMDPKKLEALDQLAFKAGKRVMQVLVPEFRMNQMLRTYCKAFRPLRPIDMNTLRQSQAAIDEARRPADVTDLINEDDFANLYAKAASTGAVDEPILEGEVIEDDAPVVMGSSVDVPQVTDPSMPGVASSEPELPALTFAEAQAMLGQSNDREDIAQVVLRFAKSKFRRALLLSVQGDLITGWRGMGQGVSQRAVRRIGVSLREQNTFKMVRDLRSHFTGPMKRTPGTAVFFKLLGAGYPSTAVLLPLLVRSKPVHILYLDAGAGQVTPPDVGELLILSQAVGRSYEALIRKRLARQTGP